MLIQDVLKLKLKEEVDLTYRSYEDKIHLYKLLYKGKTGQIEGCLFGVLISEHDGHLRVSCKSDGIKFYIEQNMKTNKVISLRIAEEPISQTYIDVLNYDGSNSYIDLNWDASTELVDYLNQDQKDALKMIIENLEEPALKNLSLEDSEEDSNDSD